MLSKLPTPSPLIVWPLLWSLSGMLLFGACHVPKPPEISFSAQERQMIASHSPLPPLPKSPTNRFADDPKAAHFGRYLFFERRLSANRQISCASCHNPALGWGDGLPLSKGLAKAGRHAPSLWNLAYYRWFFWDGRTDSLWSQALQPLENPVEMGLSRLEVAHLISQDSDLRRAYEAIFGTPPDTSDRRRFPAKGRPDPEAPDSEHHLAWLSMASADQEAIDRLFSNVGKALEAFQRKLVSNLSPFDRFAAALQKPAPSAEDLLVMPLDAQRGLKLFIGRGACNLCHTGPNFTDSEFHNIGLPQITSEPPDIGRIAGIDSVLSDLFNGLGRFSDDPSPQTNAHLRFLNKNPVNLGAFKTPTLREIASNAPYMHDGRFDTLDAVLSFYSDLQGSPPVGHREESLRPLLLTPQEKQDLIAFLKALSSDPLPPDLTRQPLSPLP